MKWLHLRLKLATLVVASLSFLLLHKKLAPIDLSFLLMNLLKWGSGLLCYWFSFFFSCYWFLANMFYLFCEHKRYRICKKKVVHAFISLFFFLPLTTILSFKSKKWRDQTDYLEQQFSWTSSLLVRSTVNARMEIRISYAQVLWRCYDVFRFWWAKMWNWLIIG